MKGSKKFLIKYLQKVPLGLIGFLIILSAALFFFTYIIHEVFWEKEEAVDEFIFSKVSRITNANVTQLMKTVTYFASATFLQIGYAIVVVAYLISRNYKRAIEIAIIGIGGFVLNYFMKISFQRIRPANPLIDPLHNFSFPSGHATSAFIFYGLLAYLVWKAEIPRLYRLVAGILLVSFSLLIGFSRIYLRVHFFSDVLGGFCIGFAWLLFSIWLFSRLKKKSDDELSNNGEASQ